MTRTSFCRSDLALLPVRPIFSSDAARKLGVNRRPSHTTLVLTLVTLTDCPAVSVFVNTCAFKGEMGESDVLQGRKQGSKKE